MQYLVTTLSPLRSRNKDEQTGKRVDKQKEKEQRQKELVGTTLASQNG